MDVQKTDATAWAARHGVRIVAWHEDRVSGTAALEARPGLVQALASLKSEKADILLVQKRDRLARDAVEAGIIERAVKKLGAEVRTSDGNNEPATATTKLVNGILDNVAAFEGAQIRLRIQVALREKRARGEKLGGRCPFGYTVLEQPHPTKPAPAVLRTLVAHAPEQLTITTARKLREEGLSLRAIVSVLQDRGVVSRSGKPLGLTQVAALLQA